MIQINVNDEISPGLKELLTNNKTYIRRASKSLGWWFQKNTKAEVATGAPGGKKYPERIPYKLRKALGDGYAPKTWYGKMRRAIGYEYRDDGVDIGWTSSTAAYYGRIQEHGYSRSVTEYMRKKWAAINRPLAPTTKELHIPARPVFEPVTNKLKPQIAPYVEEKFKGYLQGMEVSAKKNRRRYRVYR